MRLDTNGTGDAGGPDEETDRDMYSKFALADTRRALAYLRERYGAKRFALIGLCSGDTWDSMPPSRSRMSAAW